MLYVKGSRALIRHSFKARRYSLMHTPRKLLVLAWVALAAAIAPVAATAAPVPWAPAVAADASVTSPFVTQGSSAPPVCSTAGNPAGVSWGQRDKQAIPVVGNSLTGTITEDAGTDTPTGLGTTGKYADVIGRIGVQPFNGGAPQIQIGIREQDHEGAFFMVEEQGASPAPTGPGWFTITEPGSPTFYEHWSAPGTATPGTPYAFSIKRTAANSYQAFVPGYTSPVIAFPAGIDTLTYVNETRANSTVCPTSYFEFANPTPYAFNNTNYNGGTGINGPWFIQDLYTSTHWGIFFPNDQSCQSSPC